MAWIVADPPPLLDVTPTAWERTERDRETRDDSELETGYRQSERERERVRGMGHVFI